MKQLLITDLPSAYKFYSVKVYGGGRYILTKIELDGVIASASPLTYVRRIDGHINKNYIISTQFDKEFTKSYFESNREKILNELNDENEKERTA